MEKEIMTRESEKMPLASPWVGPFQAMENWFEDIENRWMQPRWLTSQRMPVVWGYTISAGRRHRSRSGNLRQG